MDDVKNMKCLMTLTDGEVVYGAPDAPVKVRSGTDSHEPSGLGLHSTPKFCSQALASGTSPGPAHLVKAVA